MYYAGIDAHKRTCTVTIIDERGRKIKEATVATTVEALRKVFEPFKDQTKAVVETCLNWQFIYQTLNDYLAQGIIVANAYKLRLIAEAKVKTDQIGALTLAQLLRVGYIPKIYIPSEKQIKMRDLMRSRNYLVRVKTRLKNKIHSLLDKKGQGTLISGTDLFGKAGRQYLRACPWGDPEGLIIHKYLDHIERLEKDIADLELTLRNRFGKDKDVLLLQSIPGIGKTASFLLVSEIGQISRFPNPERLCSYAGLTPRLFASGEKEYHGHITKQGNKHIRWILTECAQVAIRHSPGLLRIFSRIKEKRGGKIAVIAVARRLLESAWYVLNKKEAFQEVKAFPYLFQHASPSPTS